MIIKFSKRTLLAIEAVLDISYHVAPNLVQSKDLSERHNIPRRYLEQVLQGMVKRGVLKGTRGPRGGYSLAMERRKVSIADILAVINSIDKINNPLDDNNHSELSSKVLRPLLKKMHNDNMNKLKKITLHDLCEAGRTNGIKKYTKPVVQDFSI